VRPYDPDPTPVGLTSYERFALERLLVQRPNLNSGVFLLDDREATAVSGILRRDRLRREFYQRWPERSEAAV
jgi:hypothetical protein